MVQLTDMPVLAVGEIPEFDCTRGVKSTALDDVLRKEPFTHNTGRIGTFPFDAVREHVIGMGADEKSREKRVEVDSPAILHGEPGGNVAAQCPVCRDRLARVREDHWAAEESSLCEVIRCRLDRRHRAQLWMHQRAVITLAVVLKDNFPVGLDVVNDPVGRDEVFGVASVGGKNVVRARV